MRSAVRWFGDHSKLPIRVQDCEVFTCTCSAPKQGPWRRCDQHALALMLMLRHCTGAQCRGAHELGLSGFRSVTLLHA